MPVATDPNQWAMNMPEMETDVIQQSGVQPTDTNTFQTNIQNVEVGRDKLVLVNDQGSIKMLRASQLPTMTKQNDVPTTQTPPPTVIQMPLDQYLTKGLVFY